MLARRDMQLLYNNASYVGHAALCHRDWKLPAVAVEKGMLPPSYKVNKDQVTVPHLSSIGTQTHEYHMNEWYANLGCVNLLYCMDIIA